MTIRCLTLKPGEALYPEYVASDPWEFQRVLGGFFTQLPGWCLDLPAGVVAYIREGDFPEQLSAAGVRANFTVATGEVIRGTMLITAVDDEGRGRALTGLEESEVRKAVAEKLGR